MKEGASPGVLLHPATGGPSLWGGWSAPELRDVVDRAPHGPLNQQAQPPRGVEGLQGSGLRHSCRGRTRPPLRAQGRVPRGWQAARGCSESCSWLPASHMDLHTAPRMTTGRPRSPAAFLQLRRCPRSHCSRQRPRGLGRAGRRPWGYAGVAPRSLWRWGAGTSAGGSRRSLQGGWERRRLSAERAAVSAAARRHPAAYVSTHGAGPRGVVCRWGRRAGSPGGAAGSALAVWCAA